MAGSSAPARLVRPVLRLPGEPRARECLGPPHTVVRAALSGPGRYDRPRRSVLRVENLLEPWDRRGAAHHALAHVSGAPGWRVWWFDHSTSRASDRDASERFYGAVLRAVGVPQTHSGEHYAEWDDFSLAVATDESPAYASPPHRVHGAVTRARGRVLAR